MGWIEGGVGELRTERALADIPDVLPASWPANRSSRGWIRTTGACPPPRSKGTSPGPTDTIFEGVGDQRPATYQPFPSPFRIRIDC